MLFQIRSVFKPNLGGSETEPTFDAVLPVMGVLYARTDVAHTYPSSVVVDRGICHTLFASGRTDLIGWKTF